MTTEEYRPENAETEDAVPRVQALNISCPSASAEAGASEGELQFAIGSTLEVSVVCCVFISMTARTRITSMHSPLITLIINAQTRRYGALPHSIAHLKLHRECFPTY